MVESEDFRFALEASPVAMLVVGPDGVVRYANARAHELFRDEHLVGKSVESFMAPELRQGHREDRAAFALEKQGREMGRGREVEALREDGSRFPVEIGLNPVRRAGVDFVLASVVDISERLALVREREAMLQRGLQQERVASLGMLASGIAHDFNNLLVGILGNVELALESVDAGSPAAECLQDALNASLQAASLASQLTLYPGKGERQMRLLDLSATASQVLEHMRGLVPQQVEVHLDLPAGLPRVHADQNQIRQVLMNLISNAVQAIGEAPGEIWLSTSAVELAPGEWAELGLASGRYTRVEVRDTGCGMGAETQARMFEPFFTTKEKGHGLGLAATLGVLQAHLGGLRVHSEVGQGTRITVLLPAVAQPRA